MFILQIRHNGLIETKNKYFWLLIEALSDGDHTQISKTHVRLLI